jgi:hypothetical protein
MDRLDRLGWAAGIAVLAHGVRLGVRVTGPEAMEGVASALPPGWSAARSPEVDHLFSLVVGGSNGDRERVRRLNLLYRGIRRVARSREQEEVFESLKTELRHSVAEFAPRRVFVHAGVVAWRGQAIVVPGRTFTGKTTLVAELVRAGATYYSDEYAALDGRGRVHPFVTPLSIRDGFRRGREVPPEIFGGTRGSRPIPLGAVVMTEYRPGATWRARRRSEGEGALALLGNTVAPRRRPDRAMAALGSAVPGALVLAGPRGEAAESAAGILSAADRWFAAGTLAQERLRGDTGTRREMR